MWLSDAQGALQDWLTQQWVMASGRTRSIKKLDWLAAPAGGTRAIGDAYLTALAQQENLTLHRQVQGAGLIPTLTDLQLTPEQLARLHPEVGNFYTHTGNYTMDVWHCWHAPYKTGYRLLSWLYSRRLQQLNLPIAPLDAAFGIDSEIIQLRTLANELAYTIWFRKIRRTGQVIYSGSYGTATPARMQRPCLRVAFPLPNGNAQVFLRPEVTPEGGLLLVSQGRRFGDAGFYFTVRRSNKQLAANYIRGMHETIHVYVHTDGQLRTDHILKLWGRTFLHLHYKMQGKTA